MEQKSREEQSAPFLCNARRRRIKCNRDSYFRKHRILCTTFFFLVTATSFSDAATLSRARPRDTKQNISRIPKLKNKIPSEDDSKSVLDIIKDARRHLVAAGVARSVSIFGMYPVDTIKTRIQMGVGIKLDGLYKGVGGSLFGQVPYGYV